MSSVQQNNTKKRKKGIVPDVLYHATTSRLVSRYLDEGRVSLPSGRPLFLSRSESHAWQVAHRLPGRPRVLYVDANQARYKGHYFQKNRASLWQVDYLSTRHVLNLQPYFSKQISSGGIPYFDTGSEVLFALQQLKRDTYYSWEVSKGKIEPGEHQEMTAVREVREEMGYLEDLEIKHYLGETRFGFYTPQRQPRLKVQHIYLMRTSVQQQAFVPAAREGVVDVKWFTFDEAKANVGHRSLISVLYRAKKYLTENGVNVVLDEQQDKEQE